MFRTRAIPLPDVRTCSLCMFASGMIASRDTIEVLGYMNTVHEQSAKLFQQNSHLPVD